ncbi:hypothetical protein NCG97_36735 [Streptomyces lydicamycinicus]|uniref:hypothetical protein n=1 Tax=Streptomyces lydicamycinicus TaxID=1546107 RepID=UPI002035CCEF|nr:hypothetical protein [Streptomyces lydicamycinicus]USA04931.1 hypothetical protein NCG97_36735 [Streptomyces lydicamycinicus]
MTRRPIKALMAAIAMAVALTAGSTASASAVAPTSTARAEPSLQCGEKMVNYSEGRWTYSEARLCLHTDGELVRPVLEVEACQYYWGAAWYNAGNAHKCKIDFAFTVLGPDGNVVNSGTAEGDATPSAEIFGEPSRCAGSGTYQLRGRYVQHGPYWTETSLDSGFRAVNIDVPCGG